MKNIFASKTVWFNTVMFVLTVAQLATKHYIADPTVQAACITLINFFLRLETSKALTFGKTPTVVNTTSTVA